MWPSSAPNAVVGGGARPRLAEALGSRGAAGEQADGGALDVALAARDLAGEPQPRLGAQTQLAVEQLGAVEERVAMQAAEPRELGAREAGDDAEDARLLAVLQLGLEADHVPQRAQRIVLPQLHDGIGPLGAGVCGLVRPTGFIGPKRSVSRPRSAITSMGRQPSK